jgi:ArsR family transcriptional regulator
VSADSVDDPLGNSTSAGAAQFKITNEVAPMPELSQFKAEFFKALSHPLRIRILDALREGEVTVGDLTSRLGVEQSTLSQQLAILRNRDLIVARKSASNAFYSVHDPAVFRLLDVAREIFNNRLIDVKDMLSQLRETGAN